MSTSSIDRFERLSDPVFTIGQMGGGELFTITDRETKKDTKYVYQIVDVLQSQGLQADEMADEVLAYNLSMAYVVRFGQDQKVRPVGKCKLVEIERKNT